MEAWRKELYLAHSSGREWKDHKYLYKEGNRYIYPEDVEAAKMAKQNKSVLGTRLGISNGYTTSGPGARATFERIRSGQGLSYIPVAKVEDNKKNAMSGDPRYQDQRGAMNNDPRYKEGPKSAARLEMEKNAKNYNQYSQKNIANRLKTRESLNAKRRSEIEELEKRLDVLNKNEWKVNGGKNYKDVGGRATDLRNEIYKKQAEINKTSGHSLRDDYENENRRNVMKNAIEKNREDRERRKREKEAGKYYAKNKGLSGFKNGMESSFITSRPGSRAMDDYLRKNGITYNDLRSPDKASQKIKNKVIDNVAKDPDKKNAMTGDSRYHDQRGAMNNDPRYKDMRKNAMTGDSRYQDQRGTGSDPRYRNYKDIIAERKKREEREREARRRKVSIHRDMVRKRSQRV